MRIESMRLATLLLIVLVSFDAAAQCVPGTLFEAKGISDFTIVNSHMYAVVSGRLLRLDRGDGSGGTILTLGRGIGRIHAEGNTILALTYDFDGNLREFWTIDLPTMTASQLAIAQEFVTSFGLSRSFLYWIESTAELSTVKRVSRTLIGPLAAETVVGGLPANAMLFAIDDGVVVATTAGVSRIHEDGRIEIVDTRSARVLDAARDGAYIDYAIETAPRVGFFTPALYQLLRFDTGEGRSSILADRLEFPVDVFVAPEAIYYASSWYAAMGQYWGGTFALIPNREPVEIMLRETTRLESDTTTIYGLTRETYHSEPDRIERRCRDFMLAPSIASVTPSVASAGTRVAIRGERFEAGARVRFGARDAVVEHVTSDEILAVVPAGSGTVEIQVINPDGRGALAYFRYERNESSRKRAANPLEHRRPARPVN